MSDADLQPHRQKMWLTSHDDEFRTKRDDVLNVYYRAPAHEHVICLDEMTGLQALEHTRPDLAMTVGRPERRDFEYIRHGTLCFMGAYDVRQGKLFGEFTEGHNSETFVDLLDYVDAVYPEGKGHLICDNLAAHNTDDVWDWLEGGVEGCDRGVPRLAQQDLAAVRLDLPAEVMASQITPLTSRGWRPFAPSSRPRRPGLRAEAASSSAERPRLQTPLHAPVGTPRPQTRAKVSVERVIDARD